jgi:hypothetical protein
VSLRDGVMWRRRDVALHGGMGWDGGGGMGCGG